MRVLAIHCFAAMNSTTRREEARKYRVTKSRDDRQLTGKEAASARDEVLKRMLKTPPKPHKEEPRRRAVTGKNAKRDA